MEKPAIALSPAMAALYAMLTRWPGRVTEENLMRFARNPNLLDANWDTVTVEEQLAEIEALLSNWDNAGWTSVAREHAEKYLRGQFKFFERAQVPGRERFMLKLMHEQERLSSTYNISLEGVRRWMDSVEHTAWAKELNGIDLSAEDAKALASVEKSRTNTTLHEIFVALTEILGRVIDGQRVLPYELLTTYGSYYPLGALVTDGMQYPSAVYTVEIEKLKIELTDDEQIDEIVRKHWLPCGNEAHRLTCCAPST